MAEQDPQNTPENERPEGAADASGATGDGASGTDDIAEALAKSEQAAGDLGSDAQSAPPPPDVSDAASRALKAAQEAIAAAKAHAAGAPLPGAKPAPAPTGAAQPDMAQLAAEAVSLPDFGATPVLSPSSRELDLLADVNLNVTIELGRTRMLVEDVLRLGEGSVVELDKLAGDPVDVFVNGRHVARGEVLVVNDNFCVRVSEILSRTPGADD